MSKFFETLSHNGGPVAVAKSSADAHSMQAKADFGSRLVWPKENDDWSWVSMVSVLRRHWKLSALFALGVMTLVIVVTLVMNPVYESVAAVQVDPPGAETFSLEGGPVGGNLLSSDEFQETQSKALQTDGMALEVIRAMHLDTNPEYMTAPNPIRVVTRVIARLFKKKVNGGDKGGSPTAPSLTPSEEDALNAFQQRLTVRRDTGSRIIFVSFAANSPRLSAEISNTLIAKFIDKTNRDKRDILEHSTAWLSGELDDIRQKSDAANRALVDFQKRSGIVGVDPNSSTFSQQVADLNKEFTSAQSERIQLQAYLNKKDSPDSLPQFRNHPVSTFITQRIADVSSELSQQRVIYGQNHPNVKKLERQLQELQSQLGRQEKATVEELQTNYAAARARENLMTNQKRETAKGLSDMAEFMSLKKEADVSAELYNNLYSRAKESAMAAASRSSSIRVVDPARNIDQPTRPKPLLNLAVGLLISMVGGVAVAFVREQLDKNTVRTPQDIKNCLGTGAVSIVPAFAAANGHRKKFLAGRAPLALLGAGEVDRRPQKFMVDRPSSPESEALRSIYTSIMLSRPERPFQVLQIASSFAGEGKTTLAVNLAITLAQHGPTCLVDGDVRRGRVASVFGLEPQHGLEAVLSGSARPSDALLQVPDISNLQVLPAGLSRATLTQIAWIQPLRNLIDELRERFEFIIIDSPPVLTHADARAISTAADGIVFVGRFGATTQQAIVRSMELLSGVHSAPIIEVVLNAAALSPSEYPYYEYEYESVA